APYSFLVHRPLRTACCRVLAAIRTFVVLMHPFVLISAAGHKAMSSRVSKLPHEGIAFDPGDSYYIKKLEH
ncbi:MAG: hypothetical protein IJ917_02525, partial [Firmicutes bacterium]|nr:hypothetical protein [Bacillota bacterium]